jgi:hypothetical protein
MMSLYVEDELTRAVAELCAFGNSRLQFPAREIGSVCPNTYPPASAPITLSIAIRQIAVAAPVRKKRRRERPRRRAALSHSSSATHMIARCSRVGSAGMNSQLEHGRTSSGSASLGSLGKLFGKVMGPPEMLALKDVIKLACRRLGFSGP